jgi:hypothetical protein
MIERYLQRLTTDDADSETPAQTRDRLKAQFAPGATRRMTTLGLLVGSVLQPLEPGEDDSLVYASGYAESCALESFLDSFPTPSPTLFQTSIHPSAVQQLMIGRQKPVRTFLPLSGGALLAFHALRTSFGAPAPRSILCGGEEKGTWLLDYGLASDRTFAFAAAFSDAANSETLAAVRLVPEACAGSMGIATLFDLLHLRRPFDGPVAPGWRLSLAWR